MRKALLLSLLLSLAACSVDSSNDSPSPGETHDGPFGGAVDRSKPTLPGLGDGEDSAPGAIAGGAPPPSASVPAVGGATSSGGVVGGGLIGGGSFAGGTAGGPGGTAGGAIGGSTSAGSGMSAGESASEPPSDGDDGSSSGAAEPGFSDPIEPRPGTTTQTASSAGLTAGAWDDNLNYERFRGFLESVTQTRTSGILPFSTEDFDNANEFFSAPRPKRTKLDVALVIDTTGSMGDEISYLQREFIALSSAIEAAYPDAEQRWALVVYKDRGDVYLTRWYDFRDQPEAFREKLGAQSAGGGGDFPEAPDAAFEVMNQFAWRTADDVARLAFWVADAPHQDDKAGALAKGIRDAQGLGIHVYPVASSGIDEFTELTMRSSALLTGGRYLFLTNDSGIGGAHKEPSIPCYFVTSLKNAITRMVEIELSGEYHEPEQSQILRTGGNPQDGACTLASGSEVTVF